MFATSTFLKDNFGDTDGVTGLVGKHWPVIPAREAVRKWFSRASISSEWWPVLLIVLEKENGGVPVSLAPYSDHGGSDNGIFG